MRRDQIAIVQLAPLFGVHPVQTSLVECLLREGWEVHVFFQDYPHARDNLPDAPGLHLHPFEAYLGKAAWRLARSMAGLVPALAIGLARLRPRAVVAVEPLALFAVTALSAVRRVPVIYLSLELLFLEELAGPAFRTYKRLERLAARRAALCVTQDHWRADLFAIENGVPRSRVLTLPNSGLGPARPGSSRFLHRRLGLPDDRRIVLHPGSALLLHRAMPELRRAVDGWPEDWSLVFHIGRDDGLSFDRSALPEAIVLSEQPVPTAALPDIYASADVGLALYMRWDRPTCGQNLDCMGHSSGKFNLFLRHGKPTITTRQATFEHIFRERRCGLAIDSIGELGDAVRTVFGDYRAFSEAAVGYHDAHLVFDREARPLLEWLATRC